MQLQLTPEEFLAIPPNQFRAREQHFRLQISRNTLWALILSILLHALFFLFHIPNFDQVSGGSIQSRPIEIRLEPQKENAKQAATAPQVTPQPTVETPPEPPKKVEKPVEKTKVITQKKPVVKPTKSPVFSVPKALAKTEPQEIKPPEKPLDLNPPEPAPAKQAPTEAPTDMMAFVKAKRAERLAKGEVEQVDESKAEELGNDADDNNKLRKGINAEIVLTQLSRFSASYRVRWRTSKYSNIQERFFQVDVTPSQDVRREFVKKNIEFIQSNYDGDFVFYSLHWKRPITVSARVEDTAELEEFLMIDFFGPNYKNQ